MILKNKKRFIRHQYTIIELLVVLVIAGLLTGMTVSGIRGALARQGATGAVRTLANKISLAQSFAVSKNRYVALIVPDYDGIKDDLFNNKYGYKVTDKADGTSYWNGKCLFCFRKNRMCYVDKQADGTYKFDRWVDGYEWQTLPPKTVALITTDDTPDNSKPVQVTNVPDPTDGSPQTSTSLIFKPSGALVNTSYNGIVIRIFRAAYGPGDSSVGSDETDHFIWQGTENKNKGWKIVINGFTGRVRFCLGGESIDD